VREEAPEGFWLAPMEPDNDMMAEAHREYVSRRSAKVSDLYRAMRNSWLSRTQNSSKGDEGMQHE
jgi:hypothetical protein